MSGGELLDHLVGAGKEGGWDREAESSGGPGIDYEFKLDWGLHGKLSRFVSFENAISIGSRAPIAIARVVPIRDKAAALGEESKRIDGGYAIGGCEGRDLSAIRCHIGIGDH